MIKVQVIARLRFFFLMKICIFHVILIVLLILDMTRMYMS